MKSMSIAAGLIVGALLLLAANQAEAQYRYTDDKGVTKTTQYKLDVPPAYRDSAVWIGQTGVGLPGLSADAKARAARDDANRRINQADAELIILKMKKASDAKAARGGDDEDVQKDAQALADKTERDARVKSQAQKILQSQGGSKTYLPDSPKR